MNEFVSGMLGEYKVYFLILCLVIIFIKQPSISFFIGLLLKLFRVKYSDSHYMEYDEKIYNQQLFRLKRGVRTVSPEDAKLISDALNDGRIDRSTLRFTSFFGPVGVKRTIRLQLVNAIFFGLLLMSIAFEIIYNAPYMKPGYVTYNTDSKEELYISKHRVYNKTNNQSYNKLDCLNLVKKAETTPDLKNACVYITTDDPDMQSELQTAISSERHAKKWLIIAVVALFGFGAWLIIGFNNFVKLNKSVCDLKNIR
ncbi:hypothetical protein ACG0Z5_10410 [Scandinavium sp. M-37]|uniref:hypothetical protein n=1 Tax=Scandinavium sp. M-37 TaxID=3373077 RepID=UPI003745AB07